MAGGNTSAVDLSSAFFWLEVGEGLFKNGEDHLLFRTYSIPNFGSADVVIKTGDAPSKVYLFVTVSQGANPQTYRITLSSHTHKILGVSGIELFTEFLEERVFPAYPAVARCLKILEGHISWEIYSYAHDIVHRYHIVRRRDMYYAWDPRKGIYVALDDVDRFVRSVFAQDVPPFLYDLLQSRISRIADTVKSLAQEVRYDFFDDYSRFIPLANGDFDTKKKRLYRPSPDRPFTFRLATPYDPTTTPDLAERYIDNLVSDPTDAENLKRLLGYILWPGQPHRVYFILYGSGSNGKSTFLNVLASMLGEENVASVGLHEILNDRWATGRLLGKVVSIATETPEIEIRSGADDRLKAITGGDLITVEFKYRQPFEAHIHSKLVFAANQMPRGNFFYDKAHTRRLVLITFDKTFPQDPKKEMQLNTEEMRKSLLMLALKYRPIVYTEGFIRASTEEHIQKLRIYSDPYGVFVEEFIEPLSTASVKARDLAEYFVQWAQRVGAPVDIDPTDKYSMRKFLNMMEDTLRKRGIPFSKAVRWESGNNYVYLVGIHLNMAALENLLEPSETQMIQDVLRAIADITHPVGESELLQMITMYAPGDAAQKIMQHLREMGVIYPVQNAGGKIVYRVDTTVMPIGGGDML